MEVDIYLCSELVRAVELGIVSVCERVRVDTCTQMRAPIEIERCVGNMDVIEARALVAWTSDGLVGCNSLIGVNETVLPSARVWLV